MSRTTSPELMPVLSAGRHRSPRSGACFMEFASYLAGERWSDHPACTHPALAFLARMVNDCTTDASRSRLGELIPRVIGLTGHDKRIDIVIALRAATAALPIANEERQRALAVGILACERMLTSLAPLPSADIASAISESFTRAPHAHQWARGFMASYPAQNTDRSVARMTESVIRIAVLGIAQACSPGSDDRLRAVLTDAIVDCELLVRGPSVEDGTAGAGALQLEEPVEAGSR